MKNKSNPKRKKKFKQFMSDYTAKRLSMRGKRCGIVRRINTKNDIDSMIVTRYPDRPIQKRPEYKE